jgi:vacuolar-type H+-ATPase subunit I/STV1
MWRVLNVVELMSVSLNEACAHLQEALVLINSEMTRIQDRLHADARALRVGIESADLNEEDRATLLRSLESMERTAESVAIFTQPRDEEGQPRTS